MFSQQSVVESFILTLPLYLVVCIPLENNFYTFDQEFFPTFLYPKFACFIFYKVFLLSCIILVFFCFELLIVESYSTLSFSTDIPSPVYYILLEKLSIENYITYIGPSISILFHILLFIIFSLNSVLKSSIIPIISFSHLFVLCQIKARAFSCPF